MRKASILALALASAVAATPAQSVVIYLQGDAPTHEGGNYRFTYSGNFSAGEGVQTGSKLVVFDFKGYVDGSISADGNPNVATSIEWFSDLPSYGYTDDPDLPNLVFTYTGPDIIDLSGVVFTGLSALSTFGGVALDGFSALTVKTESGSSFGTVVASQGGVAVPTAVVPEAATWMMMVAGFGLVGSVARSRRKSAVSFG